MCTILLLDTQFNELSVEFSYHRATIMPNLALMNFLFWDVNKVYYFCIKLNKQIYLWQSLK